MGLWDSRMTKLSRAYEKVATNTHTYIRGVRLTELTSELYGRSLAACGIAMCLNGKTEGEAKKFINEQLDNLSKVCCSAFDQEFMDRGIWNPAKEGEQIVIKEKKQ